MEEVYEQSRGGVREGGTQTTLTSALVSQRVLKPLLPPVRQQRASQSCPETRTRSGIQLSLCSWAWLTSGCSLWPSASLWRSSSRYSDPLPVHTSIGAATRPVHAVTHLLQVLGSEGMEEAFLQAQLVPCTSTGLYGPPPHTHTS